MINVYVVWVYGGPVMTTLLQYEEKDRELIKTWNTDQWVAQAFDAEFPGKPNAIGGKGSYELEAIFIADKIEFIY